MDRPWGLMRGAARAAEAPRSVKPGTVGRIWRFARPYRRWLLAFLLLTVVGAGIGVATPVLAGRVVNAVVAGGQVSAAAATVVGLAAGIAALAVLEAVTGLVSRWFSSRIGEGLILDLRTAVFDARPADAGRVLHPHPHRRAGQPAQQRRDRRPAGVHLDAGRRGRATSIALALDARR